MTIYLPLTKLYRYCLVYDGKSQIKGTFWSFSFNRSLNTCKYLWWDMNPVHPLRTLWPTPRRLSTRESSRSAQIAARSKIGKERLLSYRFGRQADVIRRSSSLAFEFESRRQLTVILYVSVTFFSQVFNNLVNQLRYPFIQVSKIFIFCVDNSKVIFKKKFYWKL